jgi:hypothetical protein
MTPEQQNQISEAVIDVMRLRDGLVAGGRPPAAVNEAFRLVTSTLPDSVADELSAAMGGQG